MLKIQLTRSDAGKQTFCVKELTNVGYWVRTISFQKKEDNSYLYWVQLKDPFKLLQNGRISNALDLIEKSVKLIQDSVRVPACTTQIDVTRDYAGAYLFELETRQSLKALLLHSLSGPAHKDFRDMFGPGVLTVRPDTNSHDFCAQFGIYLEQPGQSEPLKVAKWKVYNKTIEMFCHKDHHTVVGQ